MRILGAHQHDSAIVFVTPCEVLEAVETDIGVGLVGLSPEAGAVERFCPPLGLSA